MLAITAFFVDFFAVIGQLVHSMSNLDGQRYCFFCEICKKNRLFLGVWWIGVINSQHSNCFFEDQRQNNTLDQTEEVYMMLMTNDKHHL